MEGKKAFLHAMPLSLSIWHMMKEFVELLFILFLLCRASR